MIKKTLFLVLIVCLLASSFGCDVPSEKQNELLKYSDYMTSNIKPIEDEFYKSFTSVTGNNYSNDASTYNELTTKTAVLAQTLFDRTNEIFNEINDEEILKVHKLYVNFASTRLTAIKLMISAVENNNISLINSANEKMDEANNYNLDYKINIKSLEKKYSLDILNWVQQK